MREEGGQVLLSGKPGADWGVGEGRGGQCLRGGGASAFALQVAFPRRNVGESGGGGDAAPLPGPPALSIIVVAPCDGRGARPSEQLFFLRVYVYDRGMELQSPVGGPSPLTCENE